MSPDNAQLPAPDALSVEADPESAPSYGLSEDVDASVEPEIDGVLEEPRAKDAVDPSPSYAIGEPGRSGWLVSAEPTDPSTPDCSLDAIDFLWGSVRAASTRGRSHRFANTVRQDSYAIRSCPNGTVAIAVADGVSSGPQSEVAARIATRRATTLIVDEAFDVASRDMWKEVIVDVRERILVEGVRRSDSSEVQSVAAMMSTTLVCTAIAEVHEGLAVQVLVLGDTSAWVLRDRTWRSLTAVKNLGAEIASSSVAALPLRTEFELFEEILLPGDAFFVMSDGVGDPLGNGEGEVADRFAKWWSAPPSIHEFGAQVDFARKTFDDDRTVVGVWLKAGPE
jgi:hypothetical protein